MRSFVRLGISILASFGTGFLGALTVEHGVRAWYAGIHKPPLTPPDILFVFVWLIMYALMSWALFRIWERDPHAEEMRGWVPLFFAHLLLNAAWLIFFFSFHAVFLAFICSVFLFWCIALLTAGAREIDAFASKLLIPYALWVFYIAMLNGAIWMMN